jgi:hypothetical protein
LACFAERLNELFEEERDKKYPFSRVDYANFLEVTHNQVSGWLDSRSEPNIKMLKKIADKHNVSLSWLVGETNIKNKEAFIPSSELSARLEGLPPQALEIISNIIEMARSHYKLNRRLR